MSAASPIRLFDTSLKRKRAVGLAILAVLLLLFIWFNRIPKLDIVQEDLIAAAAPVQCFQGLCIDGSPGSTLVSRWWEFSLTYLKLITLGMVFAFLVAGLTEVFFFPPDTLSNWNQSGIRTLQATYPNNHLAGNQRTDTGADNPRKPGGYGFSAGERRPRRAVRRGD